MARDDSCELFTMINATSAVLHWELGLWLGLAMQTKLLCVEIWVGRYVRNLDSKRIYYIIKSQMLPLARVLRYERELMLDNIMQFSYH